MKESLIHKTLDVAENVAVLGVAMVAGMVASTLGSQAREQWADGLVDDAKWEGTAQRGTRLSLIFYPKSERMRVRREIDDGLRYFWINKAEVAEKAA